jgi:hypothetical protein
MPQFLQVMNKYHLLGTRSKKKMDKNRPVLPLRFLNGIDGPVILTCTVKKLH